MRVEQLARELLQVINTGTTAQRERVREVAIDLLREERLVIPEVVGPDESTEARSGGFNPFGIAIPLVLMGGVLIILFPLVGFLMFVGAAIMMLWGVVATLFSRR